MTVGKEDRGRKFITTEPLGTSGEESEKVWDAVRSAFADRNCIGYWRYPIFFKVGESCKEPDILVADRELGLVVIDVKLLTIDQMLEGDSHHQQAEQQLRMLLAHSDREPAIWRKVTGRSLIALPLITVEQWEQSFGQRLNSSLFQDQLGKVSLVECIQQSNPVVSGENLNDEQWQSLLAVLGGAPAIRAPRDRLNANGKTRSSVISACAERLYELDLQQEHIGKEIPPGVQRIRGIAGSGKTILLCQKAAHMHLKHPDWDIALVFFSRTLYDQICTLVDKWLRRFSGGDVQYDPKTNLKLKLLHAWGSVDKPGLYSTICDFHGVRRKNVRDTAEKQPCRGLAEVCKRLSEQIVIEPLFDAILIDEGQDLVTEDDLKYEDKQAIYWLAYQTLRPVDAENPAQRRLIWAYDEAQSLDTLKIPTAKELFGEELSSLLTNGRQYAGGINKAEIMRRCYRTPGPILTAAHAIGMGLLRPEGMLTGIQKKEHWDAIGYEVTGDFRRVGQAITLRRPPENSPNPVPELWGEPVLEFETYGSRQEEMTALADKIWHNLGHDGLSPSRDILVVILGSTYEAIELENQVAGFLMEQGIDIYIPTALVINELKPQWPDHDPERFWHEGGVTVSRVTRAKGNEADMVYVVGLDNVARNESEVNLRNQLFVALTRARGWASLSGVGSYPLYEEMRRVITSGDTFTFTYKRSPKRDIGEGEEV